MSCVASGKGPGVTSTGGWVHVSWPTEKAERNRRMYVMRLLRGSPSEVAKKFGLNPSTVGNICRREAARRLRDGELAGDAWLRAMARAAFAAGLEPLE